MNEQSQITTQYTQRAVNFIQKHKNEPFFLYVPHSMPHVPLYVSDKFKGKSAGGLYGDVIEEIDWSTGEILKALKENGLDDNTLVIFTSDNGGALRFAQSNSPLRGSKQEMFEGGIRVPFFALWKGKIAAGSSSNSVGMLMDLLPTFGEIAEKELSHEIDGISLLPTLLGEEQVTDDRPLFWVRREGWHYGGQAYYAARYKGYKILQNSAYEPLQFFNISEDMLEATPLNTEDNEIYKELRKELEEHIRRSGAIPWQKH